MTPSPLARVAVALDTTERDLFADWCRFFGPRVGVLKVGLQAFSQWGPAAITQAREHGAAVFADLKLHDIPSTVAGAVGSLRGLEIDYLTIHAGGGPAMLRAAVAAAREEVRLLAVTLLTHLDRSSLAVLGLPGESADRALRWARMARAAGCAGAVTSPAEVAALRAALPVPFQLVTPGIRTGKAPSGDDQRRVATPREALERGSDLLVIGRPLTQAADREKALEALEREITTTRTPVG